MKLIDISAWQTNIDWKYIYNLKVVNQTTNATSSIGEFISPPQPIVTGKQIGRAHV